MNGIVFFDLWWKITVIAFHRAAKLPFSEDDPAPFTEKEMFELLAIMAKNRAAQYEPNRELTRRHINP